MWATTQDRKETERKKERNRKESEIRGEGCEEGEGSQEEGIRGRQSSVRIPPVSRGSGVSRLVLSLDRDPVGPVPPVGHVNQQVDSCQDGHSQALVPGAHEAINAAHIAGPLGQPAQLLLELVERPEDKSTDVEEDREHGEHKLANGEGDGQPVLPFAQVQQDGYCF